MRIAVLGAGIVGVASAYALARAGHEVVVIEKERSPALGTSYANAAQISPALSAPWAAPGLVQKALGWMVQRFPPLVVGGMPDPAMVRFLIDMLRAATPEKYAASKRAMVGLGEYSRDLMIALRSAHALDYDHKTDGTYVLFQSEAQQHAYEKDLAVLAELGVAGRMITLEELAAHEPNLDQASASAFGAAHLPGDETGDCRKFTEGLAEISRGLGVAFRLGTTVKRLVDDGKRITGVETDTDIIAVDGVVSCLGVWSQAILGPLGVKLPIYPLKGYSLTIAADSDAVGPHSTISHETYKVGVTNLGQRIRVGGTAELAGFDFSRPEKRYAGLFHVVRSLFPGVPEAALQSAERWSGLRPSTPDGPPIIGRIARENLFINAGHGTLGWTMACGAGQVIADLVSGKPAAVDAAPFSAGRYERRG
jgi:D-amino-acid dehydrogenase